MSTKNPSALPDAAIRQINSLGGPPLPSGVSVPTLKVIMENIAASGPPSASCRIAFSLTRRRQ